ncbi:MAG: hypothetical protein HOV71_21515 [Hamadaea sp.]|nr:hypothetical protein [Hamadaea sp.]NUR50715.1 hypothetical protein [Hamadaea sp.]NUT04631.1 hypothetical protein [Hamadaea sp.]
MTIFKIRLTTAYLALFALLALIWAVTGGFPFGPGDRQNTTHLLRSVDPQVSAPIFAVVLLGAAVAAFALTAQPVVRLTGVARTAVLIGGWTVVAGLVVVMTDARLLIIAGYTPILIIGTPFGVWHKFDPAEVFTWALLTEVLCVVAGLLLARTLLRWQRLTRNACVECGGEGRWTSREAARRWGRWAVYVAATTPLVYTVFRFLWIFNVGLGGVDSSDIPEFKSDGAFWVGLALGTAAAIGAILTVGLIRPWGERFPRWMIGLAGKRVPIKLATVPAVAVGIMAFVATPGVFAFQGADAVREVSPMLFWPLWGVALVLAAIGYHLRRRSQCALCGRD